MLSDESIEILINDSTASAEKLAEVIAVVLPKLIKRKMEKDLKNKIININSSKK